MTQIISQQKKRPKSRIPFSLGRFFVENLSTFASKTTLLTTKRYESSNYRCRKYGGSHCPRAGKRNNHPAGNIIVSNPTQGKLDKLKAEFPSLQVTNDNQEAAAGADMIIFAVKPWLMEPVIKELELKGTEILISVAAGIPFEKLTHYVADKEMTMFRLIPNTAISEMESMTLIASRNATKEQEQLMLDIFNQMGLAMLIPEEKIAATTAMTSCGIAYVLKYIQAAMQAGVEMGIYPKDGMRMVAQSVKGAAELILNNDTHPSVEIDKVCTPGGITIKGINELEHEGFTSTVIKAIKASK